MRTTPGAAPPQEECSTAAGAGAAAGSCPVPCPHSKQVVRSCPLAVRPHSKAPNKSTSGEPSRASSVRLCARQLKQPSAPWHRAADRARERVSRAEWASTSRGMALEGASRGMAHGARGSCAMEIESRGQRATEMERCPSILINWGATNDLQLLRLRYFQHSSALRKHRLRWDPLDCTRKTALTRALVGCTRKRSCGECEPSRPHGCCRGKRSCGRMHGRMLGRASAQARAALRHGAAGLGAGGTRGGRWRRALPGRCCQLQYTTIVLPKGLPKHAGSAQPPLSGRSCSGGSCSGASQVCRVHKACRGSVLGQSSQGGIPCIAREGSRPSRGSALPTPPPTPPVDSPRWQAGAGRGSRKGGGGGGRGVPTCASASARLRAWFRARRCAGQPAFPARLARPALRRAAAATYF